MSVHTQDAVKGNDSSHSPIFCSNPKRQPIPKNGWQERPTQMMQLNLSLSFLPEKHLTNQMMQLTWIEVHDERLSIEKQHSSQRSTWFLLLFFLWVCVSLSLHQRLLRDSWFGRFGIFWLAKKGWFRQLPLITVLAPEPPSRPPKYMFYVSYYHLSLQPCSLYIACRVFPSRLLVSFVNLFEQQFKDIPWHKGDLVQFGLDLLVRLFFVRFKGLG